MKKHLFIIIVVMTICIIATGYSFADSSINEVTIEPVSFNGHYYYAFERGDMDHDEAVAFLKSKGGYLASITSAAEDKFIFEYISSRNISNAMFGLSDQDKEGTWKWQNGEKFSYSNWGNGEPNGDTYENYGMYYGAYAEGQWNDGGFDGEYIICEWNKKPTFNIASYEGHKYKLYVGAASWEEAQEFCESKGGYLAIPNNKEEDKIIYDYITSSGCLSAYFGIEDKDCDGIWESVNGYNIAYKNWALGEPNDYSEPYGMYYWKYKDGTWNDGAFTDYTDNGGYAFVCEFGEDEYIESFKVNVKVSEYINDTGKKYTTRFKSKYFLNPLDHEYEMVKLSALAASTTYVPVKYAKKKDLYKNSATLSMLRREK